MTSILKIDIDIDKLDDLVNRYNNKYYRTIEMLVDVKPSIYIDLNKAMNNKDPKFEVGDHVRISTYKDVFAKKFLWLKKFKILCHGHMLLVILKVKKLLEYFTKRIGKTNEKVFRIEKSDKEKMQ